VNEIGELPDSVGDPRSGPREMCVSVHDDCSWRLRGLSQGHPLQPESPQRNGRRWNLQRIRTSYHSPAIRSSIEWKEGPRAPSAPRQPSPGRAHAPDDAVPP
jgi:hypothetical protein